MKKYLVKTNEFMHLLAPLKCKLYVLGRKKEHNNKKHEVVKY